MIAADGPRQHGLIVDLAIVDELHAHRHDELYIALRTALQKRPGARMVTISTAGARVDTPLGALRERCLKLPKVERQGALTRAEGKNLAMLEWALPEGGDSDSIEAAKTCNPASWLTAEGLTEQRDAVHDPRLAALPPERLDRGRGAVDPGRRVGRERRRAGPRRSRLPGDRDRRRRRLAIPPRSRSFAAIPTTSITRSGGSGSRPSATRCRSPTSRPSPASGPAATRSTPIVYDPRFFEHAAQNLEDEGLPVKEWTYKRNAAAAGTLHEIVSHGRLRHGGADLPRRHALAAEIRDREFGQVISKTKSREHIDCLMALAYAVDEAAALKEKPVSVYETRGLVSAG